MFFSASARGPGNREWHPLAVTSSYLRLYILLLSIQSLFNKVRDDLAVLCTGMDLGPVMLLCGNSSLRLVDRWCCQLLLHITAIHAISVSHEGSVVAATGERSKLLHEA